MTIPDFIYLLGFLSCVLLVLVMAVAILAIAERASPRFSEWLDEYVGQPTPWDR